MSYTETLLEEYKAQVQTLYDENNVLQDKLHMYEQRETIYTKEQAELMFKIQLVKDELNRQDLKMTGHNNYKNYNYFELKDFLPCTVKLLCKYELSSHFYTKDDTGYLQIIDRKSGAWMQWSTPLLTVPRNEYPKGDTGIRMKDQQALQTYARRTLWLQVLEIVEPVSLEEQEGDRKSNHSKTNNDLVIPEDIPDDIKQIFDKIKQDFGNRVQFNSTTVKNKLGSMKKNKKISPEVYKECLKCLKTIEK